LLVDLTPLQEIDMAHPDKRRGGSEKGQRERAGKTSAQPDTGMQRGSQDTAGGSDTAGSSAGDTASDVIFPEAHSDHQGALPDRGMDRDSGAGASAGHDSSTQAPRQAKAARGGQKSHVGKR